MAYYCFLCNENHDDSPTEEHFIPRSIDGPEHQWLPVCEPINTRSNSVFDNNARDILYWARFQDTQALKRSGEALLYDGTLKRFKFSYNEYVMPDRNTAFHYIYDRETNAHIHLSHVYAIAFPVGLKPDENETFCRGLAKMSIGALAYLLKKQGMEDQTVKQIFSQRIVDAMRHYALNLPWCGKSVVLRFSQGRNDVLARLQRSCKNSQTCNHVIKIDFKRKHFIHIEGMLYSQYGWTLNLPNKIAIEERELRLENSISHMKAPAHLRDMTQSPDSICILNPDFIGRKPNIPQHWIAR